MEYVIHILVLSLIFAILASSLDILAGQTGLLSIAHAAFYGIGAYASALITVRFGGSFLLGVVAGITTAALVSLVISLPSLRLRGDYFSIATFSFQMIVFGIFNNWVELTRGSLGIPGIPPPIIFGWHVDSRAKFLVLAAGFTALTYFIIYRISFSPFGRVLHAIREDEAFTKALGKNTLYFKTTAFAVSAVLAATAGSLYAHYITYIDPTSFTVMESILVISMVIIGGAGSVIGPMVGAVLLVALPEALRFIGLPSVDAAILRQIIYGSFLMIMVIFRPRGFVGKYGFSK